MIIIICHRCVCKSTSVPIRTSEHVRWKCVTHVVRVYVSICIYLIIHTRLFATNYTYIYIEQKKKNVYTNICLTRSFYATTVRLANSIIHHLVVVIYATIMQDEYIC